MGGDSRKTSDLLIFFLKFMHLLMAYVSRVARVV